ncbi:hypothetical protein CHS0354_026967 [Potamilus streckersoni]|uniref:Uncharacterized protein n=1 Tax=Potamilus streckersoni TaxID=2493646 RepID=A0AAE0SC34_9BIVA|nr:hypothetical protein CHS0354_026967 [Potamilus streckersoni]
MSKTYWTTTTNFSQQSHVRKEKKWGPMLQKKKESQNSIKKSSTLLASFLKKAKKKEAEAANSNSSESEDDSYQSIEKHDSDRCFAVYVEKNSENTEDQDVIKQVQHNDELVDSNGEDETEELSDREAENTHSYVVPAVLRFHDVGYLEFDKTTELSKVSQSHRNEMITLGSLPFQHTDNLSSVFGERSITSAWFKR